MRANAPLAAIFNDVSPDFLKFLERSIHLSEWAAHPDVALKGRRALKGFEYFGLSYHGLDFFLPKFSGRIAAPVDQALRFNIPSRLTAGQKTTLDAIDSVYSPEFYKRGHEPIIVGRLAPVFFAAAMPNCSDMPIKAPGGDFILPAEYQSLMPIIQAADDLEKRFNPHYDQFFAALTVDTRDQLPRQSQRRGGAHTDGFQGHRVQPKTLGEHSYIYAHPNHTMYYSDAYPEIVNLDPAKYDVFAAMDVLTHELDGGARGKNKIVPPGDSLALFDCYTVHEAPENTASFPKPRQFMRLTYTVRLFDRLGNSLNPHLLLPEYTLRHTPTHLKTPPMDHLLGL